MTILIVILVALCLFGIFDVFIMAENDDTTAVVIEEGSLPGYYWVTLPYLQGSGKRYVVDLKSVRIMPGTHVEVSFIRGGLSGIVWHVKYMS